MKNLSAFLFAIIFSASAAGGPMELTSASLFVDAIAGLDASVALGSDALQIPPDDLTLDLPINASASQSGQSFADALIDADPASFFLLASTEASSNNGEFSDATAASEFQGTFEGSRAFAFTLDFESLNLVLIDSLDDFAEAQLFAEIFIDGVSVFSDSLISTGQLAYRFLLGDMSSAFINVILSSSASAATPGANSFNLASASFNVVAVPEPGSALLIGTAFLGLRLRRKNTLHG